MNLWNSKIKPMLAKSSKPFDSKDWIFEIKFDGTRAVAFINKRSVRLQNRRFADITYRYPELKLNKDLKIEKAILDGEIVILKNGKSDFSLLQEREHVERKEKIHLLSKALPAVYIAFDILAFNGKDMTSEPLMKRKMFLKKAIEESERIILSEYVEQYGKNFFKQVCKLGMEGIMAKKKNSIYEIGKRADTWLKIKNLRTIDCVVCGVTKGKGLRKGGFGSLILGCYRNEGLIYVGRVGTGFDTATMSTLLKRLKKLRSEDCPFISKPRLGSDIELYFWVRPEIIAEVKFMGLTKDMRLRAPSLVRMRDDKEPEDCII